MKRFPQSALFLVGISFLFLSLPLQAEMVFEFSEGCFSIRDNYWVPSKACEDPETKKRDMLSDLSLYCSYDLKSAQSLLNASKEVGYIRPLTGSQIMRAKSGKLEIYQLPSGAKILFSKKDLKNRYDKKKCKSIDNLDIDKTFYFVNLPLSLYIIAPSLKVKVSEAKAPEAVVKKIETKKDEPIKKLSLIPPDPIAIPYSGNLYDSKSNKKKPKKEKNEVPQETALDKQVKEDPLKIDRSKMVLEEIERMSFSKGKHKLSFSTQLFYESLQGTQLSNSTKAELVNNLSPQVNFNYGVPLAKSLDIYFGGDLAFHLFDERADLFQVDNENILTMGFYTALSYSPSSYFGLYLEAGAYEEIYYARISSSEIGILKDVLPRATLGFEITIHKEQTMRLGFFPEFYYDFPLDEDFESSSGYRIPFFLDFIIKGQKLRFDLGYEGGMRELPDLEIEYQKFYLSFGAQFEI